LLLSKKKSLKYLLLMVVTILVLHPMVADKYNVTWGLVEELAMLPNSHQEQDNKYTQLEDTMKLMLSMLSSMANVNRTIIVTLAVLARSLFPYIILGKFVMFLLSYRNSQVRKVLQSVQLPLPLMMTKVLFLSLSLMRLYGLVNVWNTV